MENYKKGSPDKLRMDCRYGVQRCHVLAEKYLAEGDLG